MRRVAVTGATGFIGRHLVTALAEGADLRLLIRRPDPALARSGATLLRGALDSEPALEALVADREVVVHLAGAIRAPDRRAFEAVNALATARLARAAARAGVRRFVLVSSLAARAPEVSAYAWSKARAEEELRAAAGAMEIVIVRPPAVYGPGDRATLEIFRGLARGLLVLPANRDARFSLIFVEDLAALLAHLCDAPLPSGLVLEPDDGRPGGYRWHDLAAIAASHAGRPVRLLLLPRAIGRLMASTSELIARIRGEAPLLPVDKLGEFYHSDWLCRPEGLEAIGGWRPLVNFVDGIGRTLAWYRAAGWL